MVLTSADTALEQRAAEALRSYLESFTVALCTFTSHGSNNLTLSETNNNLAVNECVRVTTTGTLPTGLAINTDYLVHTVVSPTVVKLKSTLTGSALTITGAGSGTHTIRRKPFSSYAILRADNPLPKEATRDIVVSVSSLQPSRPGPACIDYEGPLEIVITTGRDDDTNDDELTSQDADRTGNQHFHTVAVASMRTAIDGLAAIQAAVNYPAAGRVVQDFHLIALAERSQPDTDQDGSCWESRIRRRIICSDASRTA